MLDLLDGKVTFRYLDAAQLIKHYFGFAHEYADSDLKLELGYIFWEPDENGDISESVIDLYAEHRKECQRFAELVTGDEVKFSFYSYFELFSFWYNEIYIQHILKHFNCFMGKYFI